MCVSADADVIGNEFSHPKNRRIDSNSEYPATEMRHIWSQLRDETLNWERWTVLSALLFFGVFLLLLVVKWEKLEERENIKTVRREPDNDQRQNNICAIKPAPHSSQHRRTPPSLHFFNKSPALTDRRPLDTLVKRRIGRGC